MVAQIVYTLSYLAYRWTIPVFILCLVAVVALLGVGTYTAIKYRPQRSDSLQFLGHRNDTILLKSNIDSFWSSNMSVTQCVRQGDASHDSYVYVVKSEGNLQNTTRSLKLSPVYYQDSPSYKSGILDYLYLLPKSSFMYRICMASTSNQSKNATYLLFNDIEKYWDYVNENEKGLTNSIFSKQLAVTRNNQTTCTEIHYNVTKASYYFMMVLSPADIRYSYNFTLSKVAYDTRNVTQYCQVSDSNTCEVTLLSQDFKHENYDIIAYVRPDSFENSIITHLCLETYSGSSTLQKISYISLTLFGVAGVLLISTIIFFVCAILCPMSRKYMSSGEQQKLLNSCQLHI